MPLDIAWKSAFYAGAREHYPHFFAKSGYFTFFMYDLDRFWVYDLFRMPIVDNAFTGSNVKRTIIDPVSIEEVVAFLREIISCGNLVWMSWMEPLLVYGVENSGKSVLIHWHNPVFAPDGTTWGLDELEDWWKWADFEGARALIAPSGVCPGTNPEEEVAVEIAKLAVQNMRTEYIEVGDAKIPFGLSAYAAYSADLRNPKIDFLIKDKDGKMERTSWFCFAIYNQWTQNFAAHSYFSHIAPIFSKKQRDILIKVADAYAKTYGHWVMWESLIGRHQSKELFYSRIGDINKRKSAADIVDSASAEIKKAVDLLEEFLNIRGVSLDEEKESKPSQDEK